MHLPEQLSWMQVGEQNAKVPTYMPLGVFKEQLTKKIMRQQRMICLKLLNINYIIRARHNIHYLCSVGLQLPLGLVYEKYPFVKPTKCIQQKSNQIIEIVYEQPIEPEPRASAINPIREARMYALMKDDAVNFICNIFITFSESELNNHDEIAKNIKLHMDKLHGPAWHCIVGKGFGSAVTYNNKNFLYLYLGNKAIMLFRH